LGGKSEKPETVWKHVGKVVAKKSLEDPWVWGVVKHFGLDVLD